MYNKVSKSFNTMPRNAKKVLAVFKPLDEHFMNVSKRFKTRLPSTCQESLKKVNNYVSTYWLSLKKLHNSISTCWVSLEIGSELCFWSAKKASKSLKAVSQHDEKVSTFFKTVSQHSERASTFFKVWAQHAQTVLKRFKNFYPE